MSLTLRAAFLVAAFICMDVLPASAVAQYVGGINGPYSNPQTMALSIATPPSALFLTFGPAGGTLFSGEAKPVAGTVHLGRPNSLDVSVGLENIAIDDPKASERLRASGFSDANGHPTLSISLIAEEESVWFGRPVIAKVVLNGIEKRLFVAVSAERTEKLQCSLTTRFTCRPSTFGLAAIAKECGDEMSVRLLVSGFLTEDKLPRGAWWIGGSFRESRPGMMELHPESPFAIAPDDAASVGFRDALPQPPPPLLQVANVPPSSVPSSSASSASRMDDATRFLLFGLAIPTAMGLAVGIAGARGARQADTSARPWRGTMAFVVMIVLAALAGALTLSTYGVHGGVNVPPVSSDDRLRWIPLQLLIVCAFGLLVRAWLGKRSGTSAHPLDRVIPVVCAFLGGGSATGLVLHGVKLDVPRFVLTVSLGIWACLACKFLVRFHEKDLHVRSGVLLVGLSMAVGAALLGTGSQFLGMYGFGAAAIALGVTVGALLLRNSARPFTVAMLVSFLAGLLACGLVLSSTPWWVVAVLGCVVPAAYAADHCASKRLRPGGAAAVAIVVGAAIALGAVAPGIKSLVDFMTGASQKEPMY